MGLVIEDTIKSLVTLTYGFSPTLRIKKFLLIKKKLLEKEKFDISFGVKMIPMSGNYVREVEPFNPY